MQTSPWGGGTGTGLVLQYFVFFTMTQLLDQEITYQSSEMCREVRKTES